MTPTRPLLPYAGIIASTFHYRRVSQASILSSTPAWPTSSPDLCGRCCNLNFLAARLQRCISDGNRVDEGFGREKLKRVELAGREALFVRVSGHRIDDGKVGPKAIRKRVAAEQCVHLFGL